MNIHQDTRSIKVGRVGWFEHDYVCMYVYMYVCIWTRKTRPTSAPRWHPSRRWVCPDPFRAVESDFVAELARRFCRMWGYPELHGAWPQPMIAVETVKLNQRVRNCMYTSLIMTHSLRTVRLASLSSPCISLRMLSYRFSASRSNSSMPGVVRINRPTFKTMLYIQAHQWVHTFSKLFLHLQHTGGGLPHRKRLLGSSSLDLLAGIEQLVLGLFQLQRQWLQLRTQSSLFHRHKHYMHLNIFWEIWSTERVR